MHITAQNAGPQYGLVSGPALRFGLDVDIVERQLEESLARPALDGGDTPVPRGPQAIYDVLSTGDVEGAASASRDGNSNSPRCATRDDRQATAGNSNPSLSVFTVVLT